jgi:hypothetical protein
LDFAAEIAWQFWNPSPATVVVVKVVTVVTVDVVNVVAEVVVLVVVVVEVHWMPHIDGQFARAKDSCSPPSVQSAIGMRVPHPGDSIVPKQVAGTYGCVVVVSVPVVNVSVVVVVAVVVSVVAVLVVDVDEIQASSTCTRCARMAFLATWSRGERVSPNRTKVGYARERTAGMSCNKKVGVCG